MSTQALPTALAEIVDDFQALSEPERLQLLLEFSRGLPELPERLRNHPELLELCAVFLHFKGEMLNHMAGIELQHVPYNGAAKMYTDIIGGVLPIGFSVVSSAESFIKAGQMKVLGVTSLQRSPLYQQWPAIAETLPGFEAVNWAGFCGPAGLALRFCTTDNRSIESGVMKDSSRLAPLMITYWLFSMSYSGTTPEVAKKPRFPELRHRLGWRTRYVAAPYPTSTSYERSPSGTVTCFTERAPP